MPDRRMEQRKKSLGIYLHIPFCVKKCSYCDFLSMTANRDIQEQYCRSLCKEIRLAGKEYQKEPYIVDTIFFGGGTPSILEPQWIQMLLEAVCESFVVEAAEVTIECNPGTLDEEKVLIYKEAGINRISLGLQSANDEELRLLGRIHTWEQFLESVRLVRKYFTNWNVDLMSALPGQSVESYRDSVRKVLALEPPHISAYSLIIEEGTPFYEAYEADELLRRQGKTPRFLPGEEAERRMYELTEQELNEAGYYRYEISNYAKPGYECRHNDRYWKREDYLGLGLGAASCMGNVRFSNTSDRMEYLKWGEKGIGCSPKQELQKLSVGEQMEETMFLGLRRMQGVDMEEFRERFGKTVKEVFGAALVRMELNELLRYSGKYIQLTQKGIDVSNYVLSQFLLEE